MATIDSVIASSRYDIRDTRSTPKQYPDAELLDYGNRVIRQLYAALQSLNSDLIHSTVTTSVIALAANSTAKPTTLSTIRSVWITGSTIRIDKTSTDDIILRRKDITATGRPYFWAHEGTNIIYEYTADQEYALTIHGDLKHVDLVAGDPMPFDDEFNDPIRQGIIMIAKNRNEYDASGDAAIFAFMLSMANIRVVKRNFVPKRYRLDF